MPLLQINNLTVRFGGLTALDQFNFSLDIGQLVGLIGPNGAGKTTTFNLVTGVYPPTSGSILLNGKSIAGKKPFRINRLGIARTFQNIRLFGGLSVLDNVLVAQNQSLKNGLFKAILRTPAFQKESTHNIDKAFSLLDRLKLLNRAHDLAASLPYGDQRRLEIARALATEPQILLLDEPAAGMNPQEKITLTHLIAQIQKQFQVGIWLIEHDMQLVMSICQQITVLDHGVTIASGAPAHIQTNPAVIEAYLGEPA